MIEPCRDGKVRLALIVSVSRSHGEHEPGRQSERGVPAPVRGCAGSGAAPPPARPAPRTPAPRDRGATPPGQVLHWGGQMAYLLFDSLEGLQRNGQNLGRSGTLHVQPFKDD